MVILAPATIILRGGVLIALRRAYSTTHLNRSHHLHSIPHQYGFGIDSNCMIVFIPLAR
jgi:hypothetical protein